MANLPQKMQNFQRRLFYALVSSEDNVIIENSKDSVTNNDSNTNIKIVNPALGESLRAINGHILITCDSSNTPPGSMHPAVFLRLALHIEGIGNQDKRPWAM
jgi:hypothetical protein